MTTTQRKMRWIVTYLLTTYYSQSTHGYDLTPIQWQVVLRSGHQVIAAIQFPEVLFKEPHGHPQIIKAEQERNASAISETADQMLLKANEFVAKYTEHVQRLRRKTLTLIEGERQLLEQVKEEQRLLEKERLFRVDELRKCRVEELRTAADKYHAARDKALGASSTGSSSKPICIT
jgi:hypothetical protein